MQSEFANFHKTFLRVIPYDWLTLYIKNVWKLNWNKNDMISFQKKKNGYQILLSPHRFLSFFYSCLFIFKFPFFFTPSNHPNRKLGKITLQRGKPKYSVTEHGWNKGRWTSMQRGKRHRARGSTCEAWKEAMILVNGDFLSSFWSAEVIEACLFIWYLIVLVQLGLVLYFHASKRKN